MTALVFPNSKFVGMYNKKNVDYAYLLWEDFIFKIENKNTKKGNAMYYPRFTKLVVNFVMEKDPSIPRRNKVNWHYARDDPMFTTINVISRNEVTQLYGAILPVALTNEDIRNSESYKEYYAMASGTIPPKTKGSKKKANTDTITKQKPPTAPTEKKSGKGKLKTTELETISEADLTEAEQLKIITKRSRQETHSSHASGSGADEGTGVTPGVPDAPDYDSEDDISWKSSDDDQVDEQAQDDEDADKNDVNETTQDDEDDDDHDDDEKVQDDDEHDVDETVQEDDDEEQTESDDDGDDFVHPKLTTHDDEIIHEEDTDEDDSSISSSDEEDSDNEVEGTNVEGAKSDEEATYEEDQGTEAVKDTKTDLDGRDEVMTDVILPQVQATQEIEDTHVTLTPVNPDGQQQSSNMLNPNKDTAFMEPSFTAQINRPPTPTSYHHSTTTTTNFDTGIYYKLRLTTLSLTLLNSELKKILIGKRWMLTTSIKVRHSEGQLYKALVEADDQETHPWNRPGVQRKKVGKPNRFYQCSSELDNQDSRKGLPYGNLKTHTKFASQYCSLGGSYALYTTVFKGPCKQEFEIGRSTKATATCGRYFKSGVESLIKKLNLNPSRYVQIKSKRARRLYSILRSQEDRNSSTRIKGPKKNRFDSASTNNTSSAMVTLEDVSDALNGSPQGN
ncbi:hypothetical protein Tco_1247710 [Tanacetum coccineum]